MNDPLYHPILALRHTYRLPIEPAIRALAHPIRHQPNGRRRSRQWALLGTDTAPGPIIIPKGHAVVSALAAVGLLVSGAYYFRPLRVEKTFADVV